jgi:microcystin-dependent protein
MASPFIGQITAVGFNFAPQGWAFCDGSLLPISQNDALFALIGTTFGGDGVQTFALPDLRGRTPIGTGQTGGTSNYVMGQRQGVENVTLTTGQIPQHTHGVSATGSQANSGTPGGIFGAAASVSPYAASGNHSSLAVQSVANDGGSQPHDNLQPYQTLNWIISLFGIFPSQ